MEEDEVRLLISCDSADHARHPAVWQRLDAAIDPAAPIPSLRFLETNMNSVGGVYYGPAVERLTVEVVLPKLLDDQTRAGISANDNLEELLFRLMVRHVSFLRNRRPIAPPDGLIRVALVENDPDAPGCTEAAALAEGLCGLGADAFLARPEEFEIRPEPASTGGAPAIYHFGRPVDILFRLFEIREMPEFSSREALDLAFRNHIVISSLAGELDHKSIFELFTSAAFESAFSSEDRAIFRKHILWTRLLREAHTDGPAGRKIDLADFAFHHPESFVLKPNRSYGGEGVVIGPAVDRAAWESAVESAMKARSAAVIQVYHPLPTRDFCVIGPAGEISRERLNWVCGFSATPQGLGIIGRASRSGIVNVARHGGLVPVLRLS